MQPLEHSGTHERFTEADHVAQDDAVLRTQKPKRSLDRSPLKISERGKPEGIALSGWARRSRTRCMSTLR